jgi:hypothetical protein
MSSAAFAEDAKVLALGLADHAVTQEELEKGEAQSTPKFNTPAVAYALAGGLTKGDTVEVELFNNDNSLMRNTGTAGEDGAKVLVQAGKRGVPAGGWPEGNYHAEVTISRDGKTLVEQSSKPIALE